jgi:uncharacterized protein DUF5990
MFFSRKMLNAVERLVNEVFEKSQRNASANIIYFLPMRMKAKSDKIDIPIRIRVIEPAAGIVMQVQRGRDELLPPTSVSASELVFEFEISVDTTTEPNFLGKYAQGPKDQRFIYVNSGQSAGQLNTDIVRRAKISLMSITSDQIGKVAASPDLVLETSFAGKDKFGKPTCASVKGIEWKVAAR